MNERKSILEATAELTFTGVLDRGYEPDMRTADLEVAETENIEGSAQSRTYEKEISLTCRFSSKARLTRRLRLALVLSDDLS
jgi:hypothetical protein